MNKPTLEEFLAGAKARGKEATKRINGLVTELCHRAEASQADGDDEEAESLWTIARRLEIPALTRARADAEALAEMVEAFLTYLEETDGEWHPLNNLHNKLEALIPEENP